MSMIFVHVSGHYIKKINDNDYQEWKCPTGVQSTWYDITTLGQFSGSGEAKAVTLHCPRDRHVRVVELNYEAVTKIMIIWCFFNVISMIISWCCAPAAPEPLAMLRASHVVDTSAVMPKTSDAP